MMREEELKRRVQKHLQEEFLHHLTKKGTMIELTEPKRAVVGSVVGSVVVADFVVVGSFSMGRP